MTKRHQRVRIAEIVLEAFNARKSIDDTEALALGLNMKEHGQHVEVVLYQDGNQLVPVDGFRRIRGAELAGLTELDAVILPSKPTDDELLMIQACVDAHRKDYNAVERLDLYEALCQKHSWNETELAKHIQKSPSYVNRIFSLKRLAPELRLLVASGVLDLVKASIIAREPEHTTQCELVKAYGRLPRDEMRRKVSVKEGEKVRAKRAIFQLPGAASVTIQGMALCLEDAIDLLTETIKELKRGLRDRLDITTVQKALNDKAKPC